MRRALSDSASTEFSTARVTQLDIARVAGVHNTTVSLALRNNPAIPEGTRKRIQTLAAQMGYHPDPALRALVAYRRGLTVGDRKETIAYITNANTRWGWRETPADELFQAGAEKKAAQYGYQLEHFWLGEPGLSQRRLSSMLFHRGIKGVLLASHRAECDEMLEFDWSRISAVKIGCFPHAPALHRVMNDQHAIVRLAMKRVVAAGYQRVALVLPDSWDLATDRAWSSGFLIEQNRHSRLSRLPVFFQHSAGNRGVSGNEFSAEAKELKTWFHEFEPEVILGSWSRVGGHLAEMGVDVPRDVSFLDLFLGPADSGVAGVRQNSQRVGEVATEMLVGLMQQNISGVPAIPTTTLVEGAWSEGESLPSMGAARALELGPLPLEERCASVA